MNKLKSIIRSQAKKSYLIRKFFNIYSKQRFRQSPKSLANSDYRRVLGSDINWDNPKNLIEKIYWMLFNTDTTLWSLCADKYRVREFVIERGCGNLLNELYGKWDKVEEVDYDSLPNSFVLKTNNSSGQVIIVKDKQKLNRKDANTKLNRWLRFVYGLTNSQLHYMRIEPCIIAEELLIDSKNPEGELMDYKIWCINGEPQCVLVFYDRERDSYKMTAYDTEWNNISNQVLRKTSPHYCGMEIERPTSLPLMLEAACKLSAGFPEVRVDFYEIDEKPIFGELTFSTGYGSLTDEYYEYLGSKIELDKLVRIPEQEILNSISVVKDILKQ